MDIPTYYGNSQAQHYRYHIGSYTKHTRLITPANIAISISVKLQQIYYELWEGVREPSRDWLIGFTHRDRTDTPFLRRDRYRY